jgi:hypothetical protein
MKIDNSSLKGRNSSNIWEQPYQINILFRKRIKTRWKSENAYYHSAQNLLSSSLLSKNIEIKIYRTIILPIVSYGCGTWLLTSREEVG